MIHYFSSDHITDHDAKAIALGYFDGMHKGHRALLSKTAEVARKRHLKAAMLTFDPDPAVFFLKKAPGQMLTTIPDRAEIASRLNISDLFVFRFDETLANFSTTEFIDRILKKLNAQSVIVGFDYHFAKNQSGSARDLTEFDLHVVPEVTINDQKVSTTKIIQALKEGDLNLANAMLGYPYQLSGTVVKGQQRGRTMNYPTANIACAPYVLPASGVYAVRVQIHDHTYYGMANIGVNPTFKDLAAPRLEIYLFDFNQDIYDETVKVRFDQKTRDDIAFASMTELKNQLVKDEKQIRAFYCQNF